MPFLNTGFPGLQIFTPALFEDKRGYFFESYNQKLFSDEGIEIDFVQDNQASSSYGVIRGLHFQREPHAQTKLIRVLSGNIVDAVVDSAGSVIPSLDENYPGTGIAEAAREAFSEATRFSAYAAAGFLTLGLLATTRLRSRKTAPTSPG